MKKVLIALFCLALSIGAQAQFVPGQVLTAQQLNNQFALYLPLAGGVLSGPLVVPSITITGSGGTPITGTTGTGSFVLQLGPTILSPIVNGIVSGSAQFATTGTATFGGITATPVSGSTGAFTTLSASGTVSGTGFTTLLGPYLLSATAASTYAPIASPTFTGTVTIPAGASIGGYAPLASPTFTGTPVVPGYLTTATAAGAYAPLISPALTGTPTAPTAAVATNTTQIATTAFVLANAVTSSSPTITTPNIVGVTNGSNAAAGSVGEYLTSTGTATALTANTTSGPGSISLTAGDWDVQAVVQITPAGTSTLAGSFVGVSASSTALAGLGTYILTPNVVAAAGGPPQVLASPVVRVNISTTTTYFGDVNSNFGVSTATATVFMRARRVR